MLNEEQIKALEQKLHLEDGTLANAISSEEEVNIDLPELTIRTAEQEEQYATNLRSEAKTAGVEMAIKGVRNDLGLDFQGKTMDNLLEAHKAKVLADAKSELGEPDKKITELQKDLDTVRQNLQAKTTELENVQAGIQKERDQMAIDQKILSAMPKNLTLSQDDALLLFKNKHSIEKTDNSLVISRDGQQLKDKTTASPLSLDAVLTDWSTPYMQKPAGGSGGSDEGGTLKAGTLEAFTKEMGDKGVKPGSEAYNLEMNKRISEKTLTI